MKKQFAFTLAEVLVVIGILGIVSAITIPNLSSSTNDREIVAKVKKAAADITTAYGMARSKYGPYVNSGSWMRMPSVSSPNPKQDRIFEFMSVQKKCGDISVENACLPTSAKLLNSTNTTGISCGIGGALLSNGMGIAISEAINTGSTCVSVSSTIPDFGGLAIVDIDGPKKGFNTVGIDIFFFLLSSEGGLNTSDTTISSIFAENPSLISMLFESPAYAIVGGYTPTLTSNKYWVYANHILKYNDVSYLH